jgi:peptide/nickel transport system substrate-binding protein
MVKVPMEGGTLTEGIIGSPRFINPLLATSDADLDMTALVYSGLMRKGGNGEMIPDLAEKVDISKDGLTYIFTLKNKIYFHDNKQRGRKLILYLKNYIFLLSSPNQQRKLVIRIFIQRQNNIAPDAISNRIL